jgi:signal peptidase I
MRCPACRTENDEGRPFCSACARELIPGAAAEIEPPRASGRLSRRLYRAGGLVTRAAFAFTRVWPESRVGALVAAVLPGGGHLLLGYRRIGYSLNAAFVVVLAVGLWFFGTSLGDGMAVLALGLVFTSVFDVARMDRATRRRRAASLSHVLLAVAITLGSYAAVMSLLSVWWERVHVGGVMVRLAPPIGLQQPFDRSVAILHPGDRLLLRRWAYRVAGPERGDIVRATVGGISSIQRILAVPGDSLVLSQGVLYLNGRRLPDRVYPLQARQDYLEVTYPDWAGTLAENEYAVWGPADAYHAVTAGPVVIGRGAIHSKAWVVYGPLAHRRAINHLDPANTIRAEGGTHAASDD